MSARPAYSLRSLVHAYNGARALDVSALDLAAGRIVALVGPNGSGKTTLLSILALLLSPTAGSVAIEGIDARGGGTEALRRRVTLIHQTPVLFSTTVWNNAAYGLRARSLPRGEVAARVNATLAELGLAGLEAKAARGLSGGEARRLALARGFVLSTPILLLDEPTTFLDATFRPVLVDLLRRRHAERGMTIVLATHDLAFAESLAHEIIRLDGGRIVVGDVPEACSVGAQRAAPSRCEEGAARCAPTRDDP